VTAEQLGLFDRHTKTIEERFQEFHTRHPEVWDLYVRFANELLAAGCQRYGIGALTERIRWHYATQPDGGEEFKINNDYRALYARALVQHDPRLADLFEMRERRTK
jgi:hypothetical protein